MLRFGENILWPQYYIFSFIVLLFAGMTIRTSKVYVSARKNVIFKGRKPLNVNLLRLFFFILFFMAAFRGVEITNDTYAYLYTYRSIKSLGMAGEWRMEIGYVALNLFLSKLFPVGDTGFYVLLFISSAFSYCIMEKWIEENSSTYGECIFIFYFMLNSGFMCTTRQTIAFSIILLGMKYAREKKFILFLALVILATLFHRTAVVGILYYFFINRKFDIKIAIIIIGAAAVLSIGVNSISRILSALSITTSYETSETGGNVAALVLSILYLGLLLLSKLRKNPEKVHYYSNDFFLYCIILSLASFLLMIRMPVMNRISNYFTFAAVPYVSNIMDEIEDKTVAAIIRVVLFVAVWIYSQITLLYRPEWAHLWPYSFFWNSTFHY